MRGSPPPFDKQRWLHAVSTVPWDRLDTGMAPIIEAIKGLGYLTIGSCGGHRLLFSGAVTKGYVDIWGGVSEAEVKESLLKFLRGHIEVNYYPDLGFTRVEFGALFREEDSV